MRERIARLLDRLFDRMRDRRAFSVGEAEAVNGDFSSLEGHKYALLVTFRANGEPVPSPVWFALDGHGRAVMKTARNVGKVKRVVRDGRVLFAAANARGKPLGPVIRASARLLPKDRWADAEAALRAVYGPSRDFSERILAGGGEAVAYLELTPRRENG